MKLHQILFIRPSSLRLANISVSYQTGYPINDFWFTVTAHAQNAQNKPAHIISRALVTMYLCSKMTILPIHVEIEWELEQWMVAHQADFTAAYLNLVMSTEKPPEIQPYFLIPNPSHQTFPSLSFRAGSASPPSSPNPAERLAPLETPSKTEAEPAGSRGKATRKVRLTYQDRTIKVTQGNLFSIHWDHKFDRC